VIAAHYTHRWRNAGLIDDTTAKRIVEWESAHRRPVVLWAVAGLGAIAISLGIMALVGANWEYIPAWLKLAVDFALNALLASILFFSWHRERLWPREIAALLLFGLVLSGIALIGQIYQLQSPPWRALVLWLVLSTPFLALTAFSRLNGILWAIAAVTTWFFAAEPINDLLAFLNVLPPQRDYWRSEYLFPLLIYGIACLMIVVSVLRGLSSRAESQARLLFGLSLVGLIAASSITVSFPTNRTSAIVLGPIALAAIVTVPTIVALWHARSGISPSLRLALGLASFLVWAFGLSLNGEHSTFTDMLRAIVFIIYWGAIGMAAAHAGRRGWFGFAFTIIGLRLLVLYFQAIGGLTATGLGLIGGGVLCLSLAALGWRLTRAVGQRAAGATT
jgi:uncharacterized membrane protein